MPTTYYQKHKTIEAVQFNGNWRDLYHELWPEVFANWLKFIKWLINHNMRINDRIQYGPNHIINEIRLQGAYWGRKTKKENHKVRYVSIPLHKGDYIVFHYYAEKKKLHKTHKTVYFRWKRVRFIRQKDFEAHWSKTPIKPKHRKR